MVLFLDNDVLQKLAMLELLDEAIDVAGASSVHVLYTARYRYKKQQKKLGEALCNRILAFIDTCTEIEEAPSNAAVFQHKPDIDHGEAILLDAAAKTSGSVLWTGDKRCIIALAGDDSLQHIASALAGRILCFEQIVVRLIDRCGFAAVHERVLAAPPFWDRSVGQVAFGSGAKATEPNVREALEHTIANLRSKTGALLGP